MPGLTRASPATFFMVRPAEPWRARQRIVALTISARRTGATRGGGARRASCGTSVGQSTKNRAAGHPPSRSEGATRAGSGGRGRRGPHGAGLARLLVEADDHGDLGLLALADHGELHDLTDRRARDDALEIAGRLDALAAASQDAVIGLDATAVRRLPGDDLADEHAAGVLQVVAPDVLVGDLRDAHAEPAPFHLALFRELGQERLDQVDGNRKADGSVARRHAVDADHLAGHVHEGTAGVAGIDGGIGLDEIEARRGGL